MHLWPTRSPFKRPSFETSASIQVVDLVEFVDPSVDLLFKRSHGEMRCNAALMWLCDRHFVGHVRMLRVDEFVDMIPFNVVSSSSAVG